MVVFQKSPCVWWSYLYFTLKCGDYTWQLRLYVSGRNKFVLLGSVSHWHHYAGNWQNTWSDNKVREFITVKVLHTSLLNTTMFAFKVLPLGSYAPMPVPSPLFKTILELVLWNGLESCCCISPDVINVIKMPSFQYFIYLGEQVKVTGG